MDIANPPIMVTNDINVLKKVIDNSTLYLNSPIVEINLLKHVELLKSNSFVSILLINNLMSLIWLQNTFVNINIVSMYNNLE